jgi:acetylornithine deacetylase/succinyl-diaminopimelate desuccinylase-like protein
MASPVCPVGRPRMWFPNFSVPGIPIFRFFAGNMDPVQIVSDYIRFPSVSTDPSFKDGMDGARDFCANLLKQAGLAVEIVETPLHPIVLGRRTGPKEWPHIVLYGHYDVQPADPLNLWTTPAFEPSVRNGKIFGRGTADNKGPHAVGVIALANVLKRNPELPLRVTVLIEGEEEIGSPSFGGFLDKYRDELAEADGVILSDTGSPSVDQVVITTGLRGIMGCEIRLTGPNSDLHSGIHGGAVYNPIQALCELCASLHNADGSVNVPGFYEGVELPADWEREELKKYPLTEAKYREFLKVDALYSQPNYTPIEAVRYGPTLEFNGIGGGYQGEGSKTVIPAKVFAKITCRLVPGQDEAKVYASLKKTIEERVPKGLKCELVPKQGSNAYAVCPPDRPNTPADQNPVLAKAFRAAEVAITEAFGKKPLYVREGGSVPIIGDIKARTGLDSLMIGLFLPDSRLHAPNENMDIELMHKGIIAYEKLFEGIAGKR